MAYTKTVWTDRQVTNPLRFSVTLISGTAGATGAVYDFIPNEGTISNAGTAINATNLNNIENGIFNLDAQVTTNTSNIATLTSGKVNKNGDTMTGALTNNVSISTPVLTSTGTLNVSGTSTLSAVTCTQLNATGAGGLQEAGVQLTSKYLQLAGGTITGALNVNAQTVMTQDTPLIMISTTNNGRMRFTTTAGTNFFQSGDNSSNPKTLVIGGINSTVLPELNLVTNILKINSQPLQAGSVNITPVANTPTKVTVTFPTAYTTAPHVVATPESAVPGTQVTGCAVANITTTQVDIYITRTNTNATTVHWIAMG